jgi:RHS repeat-associated protein
MQTFGFDKTNRMRTWTDGTATASHLYDPFGRRLRKTVNGVTTWFAWDGNRLHVHSDHLDTPRMVSDATSAPVWRTAQEAFGNSSLGSTNAVAFGFRFPGQQYDAETGMNYNRFRYYDSKAGRYISADPIGQVGSINVFVYASLNPLRNSDPLGLFDVFTSLGDFAADAYIGLEFLRQTANEMVERKGVGDDKFFHCLGNCEATKQGEGGAAASAVASELRELWQQHRRGDPKAECDADRKANRAGQEAGAAGGDCIAKCQSLLPSGHSYP